MNDSEYRPPCLSVCVFFFFQVDTEMDLLNSVEDIKERRVSRIIKPSEKNVCFNLTLEGISSPQSKIDVKFLFYNHSRLVTRYADCNLCTFLPFSLQSLEKNLQLMLFDQIEEPALEMKVYLFYHYNIEHLKCNDNKYTKSENITKWVINKLDQNTYFKIFENAEPGYYCAYIESPHCTWKIPSFHHKYVSLEEKSSFDGKIILILVLTLGLIGIFATLFLLRKHLIQRLSNRRRDDENEGVKISNLLAENEIHKPLLEGIVPLVLLYDKEVSQVVEPFVLLLSQLGPFKIVDPLQDGLNNLSINSWLGYWFFKMESAHMLLFETEGAYNLQRSLLHLPSKSPRAISSYKENVLSAALNWLSDTKFATDYLRVHVLKLDEKSPKLNSIVPNQRLTLPRDFDNLIKLLKGTSYINNSSEDISKKYFKEFDNFVKAVNDFNKGKK